MANTSLSTNKLQFTNTSINEINSKLDILPVGFVYIQFPKKKKPSDFLAGTWEDITDEYAGLFFRAEGGNADPFIEEGDLTAQEDKIRSIQGELPHWGDVGGYGVGTGVFNTYSSTRRYPVSSTSGSNTAYIKSTFSANENINDFGNPMAGHADGPEIRPVNVSIRIWERTA